ncbi:SpoIIE family protein phosphatase [Streptomyces himalayensis]|uniref:protein-serine/threonine phosphatase n=1 Tax=Streptomyces himalayensis subsp. himalayensis TaxID=2756131 RepID=A0A7W0DGN5_9ACTN|nr:SpoIIE family protein phosphatase [Streptomyces himalayensis]MBA2944746.1 SpoIIE family protein phosphatase [Streptomyces himalayensis subsp. himalayensis]
MKDQVLVFAGVALSAVYALAGKDDKLRLLDLAERSGRTASAPSGYGPPESYALSGRSPAADAVRAGRSMWWDAAELDTYRETENGSETPTLPSGVSLGVLPLATDGTRLGCLLVVGDTAEGFAPEQRSFLELYAEEVAAGLETAAEPIAPGPGGQGTSGRPGGRAPGGEGRQSGVPGRGDSEGAGTSTTDADGPAPRDGPAGGPATRRPLLGPALDRLGVGSFTLAPASGLIDADARVLELVGVAPDAFDGRVETLLAQTVPEDLPALMSVVEPRQAVGGRELDFRIRCANGELRWLRLSCRVPAGGDRGPGRVPEQVLGVVADASILRPVADEVSRVQRLAASLANALSVRDVSRVVAIALREPLGADRVALAGLEAADRLVVTVLDPPEPSAWPEIWRSEWRSEWPDAPLQALPTLQAALREGRPSLWHAGTELEPGLAGVGPGGLAVLPLLAQGRIAGVCLVGWDEPHEFVPEERSLLTATAGLVGQALMRAQTYDAEQELATTLQRSLLPRRLPELPGCVAVARYLPARRGLQVGGDWYDVISLSDRHVALVIGDVQGHSAAAATIMGQIRTAIRAYAVEGHPPDVVVSHANRLLVGMETDLFATCCYVDLDIEEGNAWFVRAGHLPPLLRNPDGTTEEMAIEGGLPLGVVEDAEYPMTAAGLTPGTLLVMATDGLVESSSLPLDEGLRRLQQVLSSTDPSDAGHVADDLLGDRSRREDDVALLLMRYDGLKVRPIRVGWTVWRLPDAVMHARRFTARTMRSWNLAEEADVVLLVVSELVTNALVHTHGAVRLDLTLAADRLRVAVSDSSPRAPAKPVIVDWEATGGRGLLLVEAMSAGWGSVPVSGGKQVWSEIVVPPHEPPGTETGTGPAAEPLGLLPSRGP